MKTITERQGRCIGGDTVLRAGLYRFSADTDYVIKVMTGVKKFKNTVMYLHLENVDLDTAKTKYYEVLTPLRGLWEMTENANNDE